MIATILKNGYVITMDKSCPVIEDGAVAVDNGKILAVGTTADITNRYVAAEVIDCAGKVILPGFVDAHGHAGHTFFKAVVGNTKYWMPAMTHMYKHYIDDDFWYYEGRLSALERLKNGVTTGVCVMGSQPRCDDPIHAINNAKAYAEIGLRNIIATGPCHTPWPHNFSRWVDGKRLMKAVSFEDCVKSMETVIQTLNRTNNNKTFAYVGPFGMVTSINPSGATPYEQLTHLTDHDKHQAREMLRVAKELDTRIHTDCFGGMVKLAMEDLDHAVLGPHVHIQHCTLLSDEEVDVLAATGTHVSAAGGSRAPVHKLLAKGVTVACTTDGSMAMVGFDMFKTMQRFQQQYRLIAEDPNFLPAERMLELVTIDAAKAIGLDHLVGSLETGKQADIITIDLQNPRLQPAFNIVNAIVNSGHGSDVCDVLVDGKFLMKNKQTMVDEASIYKASNQQAELIVNRAGLAKFAYQEPIFFGKDYIDLPERYDFEWQKQDGGHYNEQNYIPKV